MLSIDGLISGINTENIISGLVQLQQRQIDRLEVRQSNIRVQQQSMQGVEGRLLGLRASMSALNRSSGSVFTSRQVSSSNENVVTATVNSSANVGSYSLRVTSRAAAHQIGSNGFSNVSDEITTGAIRFQVGDRPVTEITIDSSNNTVNGLVQAINAQSPDIVASVVRDQASNSNRILLTSRHTGEANQITIDNQLDTVPGIARPDFSGPAVQSAANATIQLGSGPGAIVAQYDSNRVTGLIDGVSLNLLSVSPDQEIVINVSRDSSQAQEAIRDFVSKFNDIIEYINDQSRYDSATEQGGPLLGNRNVANLKNQLLAMVTEAVPGVQTGLNRLTQLGISVENNGTLRVNQTRLNDVLNGAVPGLSRDNIPRLFGLNGTSTNSGIQFILGSSRTQASATPVQVEILQAAERGTVLATNSLANATLIDSSNNQFTLSLDGITSETLTLASGSYSPSELAQQLQSVINSSTTLGNRTVQVSVENDQLRITSEAFGSTSRVGAFNGTAISALGFQGTEEGAGRDVVGRFIVNGKTETAVGSGRVLVGDLNNEFTADLQVRVTLTPNQIIEGVDGELVVTRGATARLDQFLGSFLDPERGGFAIATKSFESQIESIQKSISRVNQISESKREFLVKQFAALERALSSLQTTSSIVASQLSSIQQR